MKSFVAQRTLFYKASDLQTFCADLLVRIGLPKDHGDLISTCLVDANLKGQDGHGVSRIGVYKKRIDCNVVLKNPKISIRRVANSVSLCDGGNAMGFIAATMAMNEAIRLAKETGIGVVGVRNSNHFGVSSRYVEQALAENLISLVFTNSSPALPPHGGSKAFLGASPIAAGAPTGEEHPFILDMSSTVIARGKLRLAAERGEPIPAGVGLDSEGRPTRDGMAAFHGVTLPFGGMKGAAISLLMEIFSGVFTGAAFAGGVSSLYNDTTRPQNVGHFFVTFRPDLFMSLEEFKSRMDELVRRLKSQPKAEGFEEILMVGEPESRCRQNRLIHGIPIQHSVVADLTNIGLSLVEGVVKFPPGSQTPF